MKERIIVTPNLNSLSISLAYKGDKLFNTRILNPVDYAKEMLLRSGKLCDKKYISSNEELIYYKQCIEKNSYFKNINLTDIKNVQQAINSLRLLIINNEYDNLKDNLDKGIFKDKNKALFNVYKDYIELINRNNEIDSIGLIRYAIDNADKTNIDTIVLKEYPLQFLEKELINKCSNYIEKSLEDLYEVNDKKIHIESYKNYYGVNNEVASLIDSIYSSNQVDNSVVACADYKTYSQVFFDYACKYKLNLTFGEGISLINSYPGKLFNQYYHWMSDGNFGWEPLLKLIHSPYFNFDKLNTYVNFEIEGFKDIPTFWERVSRLRLTNNKETNDLLVSNFEKAISENINDNDKLRKYIPSILSIANELALPIEEFLDKYAIRRQDNEFLNHLDELSVHAIQEQISLIKSIGFSLTDDIVETIQNKNVYRQSNQPGCLHICSIEDAMSSLRDNLYICGLSSSTYPGSPKENPLLLDSDLLDFGDEDFTSEGKIKEKKEKLFNLVKLACSLENKVYLSYPGMNVSELKNNNASSLLFEIYKMEYGDEASLDDFTKEIKSVGYFDPKLSHSRNIGISYNEEETIDYNLIVSDNDTVVPLSLRRYSPSMLNTFFDCKKKFYYQSILKIPTPDDYRPYEIIPANEQGTLVHSLMEYLAENRPDLNSFIEYGSKVFDEYMNITVPLVKEGIVLTKQQFIEMLTNGWYMDDENKRKLAFKEEDKETLHDESGVMIHGFPDRVEYTDDGKAVIIDFKTENKLDNHKSDDIDTCLQVLIYAYIVEKEMGLEIDHCEYRMLRFCNGIINCKYDQEMKDQLTIKLKEFKKAIDEGNFEIEPMSEKEAKKKCSFCKYASICGRVITKDE